MHLRVPSVASAMRRAAAGALRSEPQAFDTGRSDAENAGVLDLDHAGGRAPSLQAEAVALAVEQGTRRRAVPRQREHGRA